MTYYDTAPYYTSYRCLYFTSLQLHKRELRIICVKINYTIKFNLNKYGEFI